MIKLLCFENTALYIINNILFLAIIETSNE